MTNAEYSKLLGMIPDDYENDTHVFWRYDYGTCGCGKNHFEHDHIDCNIWKKSGIKIESPAINELEFAAKEHSQAPIAKLQKDFLKALSKPVIQFETDVLTALGLPDINKIRSSLAGDDVTDTDGTWEFTPTRERSYERMVDVLQEKIVGDRKPGNIEKTFKDTAVSKIIVDPDAEPVIPDEGLLKSIFGEYEWAAFGVGLQLTWKQIIGNLPPGMTANDIRKLIPQLTNQYFNAAMEVGANRIKTEMAIRHRTLVRKALEEMARAGRNPMDIAKYLHRTTGEGELWYWARIARSESALMVNWAYHIQAQAAGCKYTEWKAGFDACNICSALDGGVWELGRSPSPVESSHPHCLCLLVPYYVSPGTIQDPWERENPYDKPYTPEEIENVFGLKP